jgi:hypothetical protein
MKSLERQRSGRRCDTSASVGSQAWVIQPFWRRRSSGAATYSPRALSRFVLSVSQSWHAEYGTIAAFVVYFVLQPLGAEDDGEEDHGHDEREGEADEGDDGDAQVGNLGGAAGEGS